MRNKNRIATDWILQRDWELAITLTFKKDCTEHRARKTMRRLWNNIDRQLYQKFFKKQSRRVERVCAFEKGQSGTHLHYHIATMPPKDIDISFDTYRLLIAKQSVPSNTMCMSNPIAIIRKRGEKSDTR